LPNVEKIILLPLTILVIVTKYFGGVKPVFQAAYCRFKESGIQPRIETCNGRGIKIINPASATQQGYPHEISEKTTSGKGNG